MRLGSITTARAYRHYGQAQGDLARSMERLASGSRIVRAADDAAGLARSERHRAHLGGTHQAVRNTEDGISLLRTVDSNLDAVTTVLQRMRDLAVQAASTATTDGAAEQAEYEQLAAELDRIDRAATFGGRELFTGVGTTLQVGSGAGDTLQLSFNDTDAAALGVAGLVLGPAGAAAPAAAPAPAPPGNGNGNGGGNGKGNGKGGGGGAVAPAAAPAGSALEAIDAALDTVLQRRARVGATQNRLESRRRTLGVTAENVMATESRTRDVDVAAETIALARHAVLRQAAVLTLGTATDVQRRGILGVVTA